jgi:polar amino acid transport system substrate-binding protein
MRAMLRVGLLVIAVAMLGHVAPATAQTVSEQSIRSAGKITIGVMIDVPPFATVDANNQPDGYDIEIAKLLCKRLEVQCDLVPLPGASRIPYLLTGKVDILVAVLGIIPSRAKQVAFSRPYAGFSQFLYSRKDIVLDSMADLKGVTVGVPRANTGDITLTKMAPAGTNILRFDDDASTRQALLSGQVDAITFSTTSMKQFEEVAGKDRFRRGFDLQSQVQGIAVRPADKGFLVWINQQLDEMEKDGTLQGLSQKWVGVDLPDMTMPNLDQ